MRVDILVREAEKHSAIVSVQILYVGLRDTQHTIILICFKFNSYQLLVAAVEELSEAFDNA